MAACRDLLPLLLAPMLAPAEPARMPAQPQTAAARLALALVVDARDRPIVDLGLDDFVIQEGDQAREVLDVQMAAYPIAVLVDTSTDASRDLPDIRRALTRFVGRLGQRPIALGALGEAPAMLTAFGDSAGSCSRRSTGSPPGRRPARHCSTAPPSRPRVCARRARRFPRS